jgi:hypothetical protein
MFCAMVAPLPIFVAGFCPSVNPLQPSLKSLDPFGAFARGGRSDGSSGLNPAGIASVP